MAQHHKAKRCSPEHETAADELSDRDVRDQPYAWELHGQVPKVENTAEQGISSTPSYMTITPFENLFTSREDGLHI